MKKKPVVDEFRCKFHSLENLFFCTHVARHQSSAVVPNLGSIEPQRFGDSVSGVRRQEILSNKSKNNKIHYTYFIFPTMKRSMNACMELVGFSTVNKVRNHWPSVSTT